MSREVVIVAYGRSAVCKSRKGSFAGTHPIEYSAQVLKGVLDKVPQLDRSEIEDVIMGCAVQHGTTSMNIAKSVCARAELPECVAGHTINRFCSSGLQAIATGANAIACGQGDVIVAGGVESMTDTYAPYPVEFQDAWLNEHAPGAYMGMGMTAENIVKNYGVTREEMDRMAYESNMKAAKAQKEGKLAPSIIPVTVVDKDGNEKFVTEDEGIRPTTTMETLAGLKPCFIPAEEGGTVTAATSSQTSDAAAFVVLMAADMDVIELNEAFAAQAIPCIKVLKMNPEKVNPYGGAMALGHPMGATGAFLTCKALDYLQDNKKTTALVTMCIGGGMGAAAVFELL